MAQQRRTKEEARRPGKRASHTGPHMDPTNVGDRFPTGACGHPIPDVGEHPPGGRHTGITDRVKETPEDPGADNTEQTRSERGAPRP